MPGDAETAGAEEIAMGAGARIITTLETAWATIQQRHPDLPDVVMITGTQKQAGGDRWGHHWPNRWREAEQSGRLPEMFIAGELLARGSGEILLTLLHEGAHALGHVRGIKDTSSGGRYHNRRFVQLAGELDLAPPTQTRPVFGLDNVTLGQQARTTYAELLTALEAASLAYLEDPAAILRELLDNEGVDAGDDQDQDDDGGRPGRKRRGGRDGRRLAVVCGCDRRLQLTPRSLEDGPILCGLCSQPFEAEGDDLDDDDA